MVNATEPTSATILSFTAKRPFIPNSVANSLTRTEHEVVCEAADGAWYHAEALRTEKSLPKK